MHGEINQSWDGAVGFSDALGIEVHHSVQQRCRHKQGGGIGAATSSFSFITITMTYCGITSSVRQESDPDHMADRYYWMQSA